VISCNCSICYSRNCHVHTTVSSNHGSLDRRSSKYGLVTHLERDVKALVVRDTIHSSRKLSPSITNTNSGILLQILFGRSDPTSSLSLQPMKKIFHLGAVVSEILLIQCPIDKDVSTKMDSEDSIQPCLRNLDKHDFSVRVARRDPADLG
jgi:hypothetical protein